MLAKQAESLYRPPRTLADLLKSRRRFTRKELRFFLVYHSLFNASEVSMFWVGFYYSSGSVFLRYWPVLWCSCVWILLSVVSAFRSWALHSDSADPVHLEEENRFLRRIGDADVAMLFTFKVCVVILCGTQYNLPARSLYDLHKLLWVLGGVFTVFAIAMIRYLAARKRIRADWEVYVESRDSDTGV